VLCAAFSQCDGSLCALHCVRALPRPEVADCVHFAARGARVSCPTQAPSRQHGRHILRTRRARRQQHGAGPRARCQREGSRPWAREREECFRQVLS